MKYADFVQLAEADKEKVVTLFDEVEKEVMSDVSQVSTAVASKVKEVMNVLENATKSDTTANDTSGVQKSSDLA